MLSALWHHSESQHSRFIFAVAGHPMMRPTPSLSRQTLLSALLPIHRNLAAHPRPSLQKDLLPERRPFFSALIFSPPSCLQDGKDGQREEGQGAQGQARAANKRAEGKARGREAGDPGASSVSGSGNFHGGEPELDGWEWPRTCAGRLKWGPSSRCTAAREADDPRRVERASSDAPSAAHSGVRHRPVTPPG